jgi:predicted phosphoribosyltransferase
LTGDLLRARAVCNSMGLFRLNLPLSVPDLHQDTGGRNVMSPRFSDRAEAGRVLARELSAYADRPDVLVLALPRGGVPVGYEVARALRAPLDVFVVRKIGVPGQEELAMGAVATGGVRVLNQRVLREIEIDPADIEQVAHREEQELRRREQEYRGQEPPPPIAGHRIILVDDGLATGSTMRAAAGAVRRQSPTEVVIAVPVAARETCEALRPDVDRIFCTVTPEPFHAVGVWYEDFSQTTDDQVRELLARSRRQLAAHEGDDHGHVAHPY